MNIRNLFIILSLLYTLTACTKTDTQPPTNLFPKTCSTKTISWQGNTAVINTNSKQTLVLIHNTSQQSFWLNHPTNQPMSAGWASQIDADHWSALTVENKKFAISCSTLNPSKILNCKKLITVCVMPKTQFPKNMNGGFWVTENKFQPALIPAIKARKITW
tara:strand:- start:44008 stop:44490 length:483 start_codon:yes stop_codon:yes gene_type:complete